MKSYDVNGLPVNDGNGIYDNDGLLETVLTDFNNLVKNMANGNYLLFCALIVQMVKKITNVRDGIKKELASKDKQIEELKQINNRLMEQVSGLPVIEEKDGAE